MYSYGYNTAYGYGAPGCYSGCQGYQGGFGSGAAIILVLFILLVIVIGSRFVGPGVV